jgi:hypothetical protein
MLRSDSQEIVIYTTKHLVIVTVTKKDEVYKSWNRMSIEENYIERLISKEIVALHVP